MTITNRLSLKTQTLAALAAIAGAVALPQLFHLFGSSLGETFLPMHLPIMLAGLFAGPFAGAAAGILGPLCSFALSGMPGAAMLPFIVIELFTYGLCAGLLKNAPIPTLAKALVIQVSGRAVRAAAILSAVYLFGYQAINPAVILTSIAVGLPGILLQLCLLPLIAGYKKHDA